MISDARQSQGWWRNICAGSLAAALGGAVAALGCVEIAPTCQGPRCAEVDVTVLTWWPSTPNGPATPLVDAASSQAGVGGVTLRTRASKNSMMAAVESLLLQPGGSERVDAFLANAGHDVLRWTPCGGEGSSERLLRVDTAGDYGEQLRRFAPAVLEGVTCCPSSGGCSEPGVYALPLGLHRINHIFYNIARFNQCPLPPVVDDSSFVGLLSCLSAGGARVISAPVRNCDSVCAADGGADECLECRGIAGESLSYLLESLLLLVSDPNAYQSYWRGRSWQSTDEATRAEPLHQALSLFQNALPFLNNCPTEACPAPATAKDALEEVVDGTAAFLVMPDWFSLEAQQASNDKVAGMPFPGTEATFLFMTDVFAVPDVAAGTSTEAGLRWLDALLDEQVQQRFARQKNALPALGDHAALRLVPSLEAQLPASVDPAGIRAKLNEWLLARAQDASAAPALEALMAQQFEEAQRQNTLRVAPCDSSPCGTR